MQQPTFTPNIARMRATVEELTGLGERYQRDDRAKAAAIVDKTYSELNLVITAHWFSYRGQVGYNFAGRKRGVDWWLPPVVVCAHYDTVKGSVGADDNASGVAVMLECTRLLAPLSLRRSVEFIATDMEETEPVAKTALNGSQAFSQEIIGVPGYFGVFNLNMVGFTSGLGTQTLPPEVQSAFPMVARSVEQGGRRGDSLAVVGNRDSAELAKAFADGARRHAPDLGLLSLELPNADAKLADLFRGDHVSFWGMAVPAVLLTDTGEFRNPHCHKPTDTASTLDYAFMGKVASALAGTLAALAG